MTDHELKCWPGPFAAMLDGSKTAEFRRHDRDFKVGDTLRLREWTPQRHDYTGRELTRRVTHILGPEFGVPDGFVMLSLAILAERGSAAPDPACDCGSPGSWHYTGCAKFNRQPGAVVEPPEPVAWLVTRRIRKDQEKRASYLFSRREDAAYEYEGWLDHPGADVKLIPLGPVVPSSLPPEPTEVQMAHGYSVNSAQSVAGAVQRAADEDRKD